MGDACCAGGPKRDDVPHRHPESGNIGEDVWVFGVKWRTVQLGPRVKDREDGKIDRTWGFIPGVGWRAYEIRTAARAAEEPGFQRDRFRRGE